MPNKHSTTSFIYVQSQKQHNSQSTEPCIFINRSLISLDLSDFNLKLRRFVIAFRGPKIWNKFLTTK